MQSRNRVQLNYIIFLSLILCPLLEQEVILREHLYLGPKALNAALKRPEGGHTTPSDKMLMFALINNIYRLICTVISL